MTKHVVSSLLVALGALAAAAPARADQCGYSPPNWNVPKGGAVFSQGGGPIKAVLNGVGETRTHTMLYLGNNRVAHTSMYTPGQRDYHESGFCNAPVEVNQLSQGYPGTERMDVAAAYQALSGNTSNLYYQRGKIWSPGTALQTDWGAAIADTVRGFSGELTVTAATTWTNTGSWWFPSHYIDLVHNYGISKPRSPYMLYQYMNIQNVEHGAEAVNDGMVCSTFLAYAQHAYGLGGGGFGMPQDITAHAYTHDQTIAAGYALYDSVKTDCESQAGWWGTLWNDLKSTLYCLDTNLCDEAAAQVRNCMAYGDCANGDPSRFDGDAGVWYFKATSISPDWIGGWVAGQNYSASDQSVWAWDGNNVVTFSGAGSVYDCWY